MKVLVCGSRNFGLPDIIAVRLYEFTLTDKLKEPWPVIIHGAATGADSIADRHARRLGLEVQPFPANWEEFGKAAGSLRNKYMLEQEPDLVIAFVRDPNNSPGTANMVLQALCAGVKVEVHTYDG